MTCPYVTSGCNYPEGECNGDCCRDTHGLESLYQELGKPALFWPIFLSLIAAALLYASIVRDGINEIETAQALADEAAAAQQQKDAAALRFDNAARAICGGPEASYIQLGNGVIQCINKQGRKTKTIPGLARPVNTHPYPRGLPMAA